MHYKYEVLMFLFVWLNPQVGSGNLAVVSPPNPYYNMGQTGMASYGPQQYDQPPPIDYSEDLQDSGFSNGAIRRGECWKEREKRGRKKEEWGGQYLIPHLLCSVLS